MHVCVLQPVIDPFKGGNHLSLFAALSDTQFTIVCNRSKVQESELPSNIKVIEVSGRIGSYYYGFSDLRFGQLVTGKYPPESDFWKQFDVIHLNQVMGPSLRNLKNTGKSLLFLIHHPVTADLEIALQESGFIESLKWRLKYYFLIKWQGQMCKLADQVITVSGTMQKRISDDYKIDQSKISVVPNGVDVSVFTPVADSECEFDVIAAGSFIHPRKGFKYLLEVYRKLSDSGKKIADVGRRSEQQIKALSEISGVQVYGMVNNEKMVDLMRHSRTLVSTSLFEGFGLTLIETLACGHPAFAFDVGAVREVLGEIDPDLIVEPRNISHIVNKIEAHLVLTSQDREKKGEDLRTKVIGRYSIDRSSDALRGIYIQN
ncbi:MAG: glycosyltransferase family 4 protein [Kiritimatiellales bacterium]|nr:glycosyltransferase family 4 protein [Kiritimatiellales bacterium]